MEKRCLIGFILVLSVLLTACAPLEPSLEDAHATEENVGHCFEHHVDDTYEEALTHCQEEICGTDIHCFEEVEEFSEDFK